MSVRNGLKHSVDERREFEGAGEHKAPEIEDDKHAGRRSTTKVVGRWCQCKVSCLVTELS